MVAGSSSGGGGGVGGSGGSGGSSSAVAAGVGVSVVGGTSSAVTAAYYGSRSRSPSRFDSTETRYEARGARESFTLASVVHRDLYREERERERGRRTERSYHHSRSRSPHSSSQSHNPSPQRLTSQALRATRSPSGSGSRSRSSSSDSVSSTSSSSSGRWVDDYPDSSCDSSLLTHMPHIFTMHAHLLNVLVLLNCVITLIIWNTITTHLKVFFFVTYIEIQVQHAVK